MHLRLHTFISLFSQIVLGDLLFVRCLTYSAKKACDFRLRQDY